MNIHVIVGPDGLLRFVYDDELAVMLALGSSTITRASHVEPSPLGWIADLAPCDGPKLGPFPLRKLALNAEAEWLEIEMCGLTHDKDWRNRR